MTHVFRLATKDDDQILRRLFYDSQMNDGGLFSLRYSREPSFFHGLEVEGPFQQTGICVDEDSGKALACFTRTVRKLWVNGKVTNFGYIANCRILPECRNSTILFKGYSALKKLHDEALAEHSADLYLSTILEGNEEALEILTSGRASLPAYHHVGNYISHALVANQDVKCDFDGEIVNGCLELVDDIVSCLNRLGERRQFAPYFEKSDFNLTSENPLNSLTRGLSISDFLVARNEKGVVGVMAPWNQMSFKQLKVERYGFLMKCVKAFWNTVMPSLGYGLLPAQGHDLPIFFVSMVAVDNENKDVFRALLSRLVRNLKDKGCLFAILGLAENDPLVPYLAGFLKLGYKSRIFVVAHKGSEERYETLDSTVPWLDVAMI